MVTLLEVQKEIERLVDRIGNSCNSGFRQHAKSIISALLWTINGGDMNSFAYAAQDSVATIFERAKIPVRRIDDNHFHYALDVPDIEAELSKPCEFCTPQQETIA